MANQTLLSAVCATIYVFHVTRMQNAPFYTLHNTPHNVSSTLHVLILVCYIVMKYITRECDVVLLLKIIKNFLAITTERNVLLNVEILIKIFVQLLAMQGNNRY